MPRSVDIRVRTAPRARLGRAAAFWLLAVTLGLLLFASSAPSPLYVVWLLFGTFALVVLAARAIPETVQPDGRLLPALRPRIAVPAPLRVAFVATIPCLMATWAFASNGAILSGLR